VLLLCLRLIHNPRKPGRWVQHLSFHVTINMTLPCKTWTAVTSNSVVWVRERTVPTTRPSRVV
jgi:hypothetical protein